MEAQGGEREEGEAAMRSPEETSQSTDAAVAAAAAAGGLAPPTGGEQDLPSGRFAGLPSRQGRPHQQQSSVPSGGHPRQASPYFQTLAVADSQRSELASLSSGEDLDHWGDQGYPKTMLTHTDDGTDVQPLEETSPPQSAGGTVQDSGELSLAIVHGEPEGKPNEEMEPISDVLFDCKETLGIFLSKWKQPMSLSERYEEEVAVRAEALVNSGRRLVQSYEQEKIRLADGLLHVHVLLSEECQDPCSHRRLDDIAAAEPPNCRTIDSTDDPCPTASLRVPPPSKLPDMHHPDPLTK